MKKQIKIFTGELASVDTGFLTSFRLIYCGMPTDTSFAITPLLSLTLGEGSTPTIYYKRDSKRIFIIKQRFIVEEVTPDYIILLDK